MGSSYNTKTTHEEKGLDFTSEEAYDEKDNALLHISCERGVRVHKTTGSIEA